MSNTNCAFMTNSRNNSKNKKNLCAYVHKIISARGCLGCVLHISPHIVCKSNISPSLSHFCLWRTCTEERERESAPNHQSYILFCPAVLAEGYIVQLNWVRVAESGCEPPTPPVAAAAAAYIMRNSYRDVAYHCSWWNRGIPLPGGNSTLSRLRFSCGRAPPPIALMLSHP